MRDIAKNIKQLRMEKNMTQDQLAERLFVTRQTVSNYETGKSRPDVDMLVKIAEVLDTDIQQLIYGPEPKRLKPEVNRLVIGGALAAVLGVLWLVLQPVALARQRSHYELGLTYLIFFVIRPLFFTMAGWTLCHLVGMALRKKPFAGKWARRCGTALLVLVVLWFGLILWYHGAVILNEWQYEHHIRGEWVEYEIEYDDGPETAPGWSMLPPQVPGWLEWFLRKPTSYAVRYPLLYSGASVLTGALLCMLGIPGEKKKL